MSDPIAFAFVLLFVTGAAAALAYIVGFCHGVERGRLLGRRVSSTN